MALPTYNITTDLFNNSFANIQFAGQDIVISLLITLISIVIITRNINKWGMIGWPINLLWHKVGIESPLSLQIILAIWLIYTMLGTSGISRIVNSIKTTAINTGQTISDTYAYATPNRQKRLRDKQLRINYVKTGELQDYSASDNVYQSLLKLGLNPKQAKKSAIEMAGKEGKQAKKLIEANAFAKALTQNTREKNKLFNKQQKVYKKLEQRKEANQKQFEIFSNTRLNKMNESQLEYEIRKAESQIVFENARGNPTGEAKWYKYWQKLKELINNE